MMAASALYPALTLDPANRLMNARVLGEWNTDGNSDLWQTNNVSSWTVSGGNLTLTSQNGTANPAQVDLRNIASGPNLDYAFFDYLQLRLQLPANYNKDLTFSFGTSTRTGFASDRVFTIPAASLATDGAFHTYRLDLGLVVWWRDNLNDLRIQPLGTTGANETATFDYVEVGDLPGDVLGLHTTLNFAPAVTIATAHHM